MTTLNPEPQWVIVDQDGNVEADTGCDTREECIDRWVDEGERTWDEWEIAGYSCLQAVTVWADELPQWRDAPNVPGRWMSEEFHVYEFEEIPQGGKLHPTMRWFGPIPKDEKQ